MNARERDVVQRLRTAFALALRRRAAARGSAKAESKRRLTEIELICDELVAEGIDPLSPLGQACVARILAQRRGAADTGQPWEDGEGFPTGEGW